MTPDRYGSRRRERLALLLLLMLTSAPAGAACSILAASVAFGAYDPFASVPLDATGAVTVECSAPYTILLGSGGGSLDQRRLQNGAQFLAYNLYIDAVHSAVWGDGSAGTATVGGAGGSSQSHAVYGRISAGQNVGAGLYSDNLVVTISF